MATEIERKFRLDSKPEWLATCERETIEQGYLAIEPGDGDEVRLRRKGGRPLLTVKHGSGRVRSEEEIALEPAQFEALWPLTEGRRVAKTRYQVPQDDLTVEVDVFEGALSGLVMAEVEFPSEGASVSFEPPTWLGEEVTGNERYANETLALEGRPEEGASG
jgi:adenylate cyclase